MATARINVVEQVENITSIEIHITSVGGVLTNYQYNILWGESDGWVDCTPIVTDEGYSKIIVNTGVNPLTEYGTLVRARDTSGNYITSEGFAYIKTSGHATFVRAYNFEIGKDESIKYILKIPRTEYYYSVYVVNADDDPIIQLENNIHASQPVDERPKEIPLDLSMLGSLNLGEYKLTVVTRDGPVTEENPNPNVLASDSTTITVTANNEAARPRFTDFTITSSTEGGFYENQSAVTIDYRNQARGEYGVNIANYIIEVKDSHEVSKVRLEDINTVGVVTYYPNEVGDFTIDVEAIDTRGLSTTVSKAIRVEQYKPVKVTSAVASRIDSSERIKVALRGEAYKKPTIKYNYEFDGVWQLQDPMPVAGSVVFNAIDKSFEYNQEAFTATGAGSKNINVLLIIDDGISKEQVICWIPSNRVLALHGYKDAQQIPKVRLDVNGRITVNGEDNDVVAYAGPTIDLDSTLSAGIYLIDNTTTSVSNLPGYWRDVSTQRYIQVAGFLEVMKYELSPIMMQRVTLYDVGTPADSHCHVRFYTTTGFTAWKQIY